MKNRSRKPLPLERLDNSQALHCLGGRAPLNQAVYTYANVGGQWVINDVG